MIYPLITERALLLIMQLYTRCETLASAGGGRGAADVAMEEDDAAASIATAQGQLHQVTHPHSS